MKEVSEVNVKKLFKDYYIKIPDFQRAYTWSKNEISQFLIDLENNAIKGKYFIGTIFGIGDESKCVSIIDGQQRITTIFLLVNAVRLIDKNFCKKNGYSFLDSNEKLVFDSNESSPFISSLFQLNDLNDIFDSLKSESTVSFSKINIYYAQQYLYYYLKKNLDIKKNIAKILENIVMIFIVNKDVSYGYQIFENLNSKGQPLNNSELIKNAFFKRIECKSSEEEFKSLKYELWKKIESYYYTDLQQDTTFDKLSEWNTKSLANFHQLFSYYNQLNFGKKHSRNSRILYSNYERYLDTLNQSQLIKEMKLIESTADAYDYIVKPREKSIPTIESIQQSILFLSNMNVKVYIPFAISFIYKFKNNKYRTDRALFKKIFCKIAMFHYVFNRVLDSKPSKVEGKYNKLGKEIFNDEINITGIKTTINGIFSLLKPSVIEPEKTIDYSEFISHSYKVLFLTNRGGKKVQTEKGYKRDKDRNLIEYILGVLELHLKNDFSSTPNVETIEHVRPLEGAGQDDFYNFCIFNYLPLENALNEKCKTLSIDKKIEYYRKSNYLLTKLFCKVYDECSGDLAKLKDSWEIEVSKRIFEMFEV